MKTHILAAFALIFLASCAGNATSSKSEKLTCSVPPAATASQLEASKEVGEGDVELLYFHTNQRCITCNAIEKLTREVVSEMKNDKVKMDVINISKNENKMIAQMYEVSWSSLYLVRGNEKLNLTELGFRFAKNSPDNFKAKLREEIEKFLI